MGLSLSVMLAAQGFPNLIGRMLTQRIKTVASERHANTAIHPRPALFHLRTVEIFRSLGMMEMMLDESRK